MNIKTLIATALVSRFSLACSDDAQVPSEKLEVSASGFVKSEDGKADSSVRRKAAMIVVHTNQVRLRYVE